ncbi:MAG TPA: DMT family transporter [Candidatus Acidoferrales bacterium]|nr:DMT family transporter [Candidatus Acidoferrales bacterium]
MSDSARAEPSSTLAPYLALGWLALLWGASYLFIKVAVKDMSPATLVLLRAGIGGACLALILAASGRGRILVQTLRGSAGSPGSPGSPGTDARGPARAYLDYAAMAVLSGLLPWTAIAWGELSITSGLASILNATTPLFVALAAYWVTPSERPSPLNYGGVAIGFVGTVILVAPSVQRSGLRGDTLGALAVLLASASYAAAAIYQRRRMAGVDAFQASLGQLAATTLLALPLAVPTLPATHLQPLSLGAALALGVGGSSIAYVLYYYLLNTLGATRASAVTFLLPITAVVWGFLLLQEAVPWTTLLGMAVILAGIFLTNRRQRRRPEEASPASRAQAIP